MRERHIYIYDKTLQKVVPIEQSRLNPEKGSKLTKFQYQANELCHDVLKYDIKNMVRAGTLKVPKGAKFFGYDMRDVMNDKV